MAGFLLKRINYAAIFGFLCFMTVLAINIYNVSPRNCIPLDNNVNFSQPMIFLDGGNTVTVSGTLAGDGIGYPNNEIVISCFRSDSLCTYTTVDQIGPRIVGSLSAPMSITVIEWNDSEIVARSADDELNECSQLTIILRRKTKSVKWTREPINQSRAFCLHTDEKIYEWTVEDSLFVKNLKASLSHEKMGSGNSSGKS